MAKVICKGTALQQDLASTLTTIAQMVSIDGPPADVETFESTGLDSSAGKEFDVTGYVEGGEVGFELFFDPALAGHQNLTDLITTPVVEAWAIDFADVGLTTWTFNGILRSFSPAVNMRDGLKASGRIQLDGIVSYPT